MNIVDFLKARVLEDGEFARLAMAESPHPWTADHAEDARDSTAYLLNGGGLFTVYGNGYTEGPGQEHEAIVKHIAHNQPLRAWADHQAKLAIIEEYRAAVAEPTAKIGALAILVVIHLLARSYVDHPDFYPGWRI